MHLVGQCPFSTTLSHFSIPLFSIAFFSAAFPLHPRFPLAWQATSYPALNHKPALMRCYKKVTLRDGDGDAWIEKFEFPALLSNLPYFVRLWLVFAEADKTGNDAANDRRLTVEEASPLLQQLGLAKSASQAKTVFKEIDSNGGGCLLFDELVIYAAKKRLNIAGTVMEQYTRTDERHASANGRKSSAGPTSPAGSNKKKSSDGAMLKPNPTLDKTEAELKSIIGDAGKLKSFWKKLDYNANGKVRRGFFFLFFLPGKEEKRGVSKVIRVGDNVVLLTFLLGSFPCPSFFRSR